MKANLRPPTAMQPLMTPQCCSRGCVEGIVEFIQQSFSEGVGDGRPRIDRAARGVGMSVRSLQRHLKHVGISYSRLVDEVRRSLAVIRVSEGQGRLIEIAFDLGYSDPAHFTRAFRRWSGVCPSEYKTQLRPSALAA